VVHETLKRLLEANDSRSFQNVRSASARLSSDTERSGDSVTSYSRGKSKSLNQEQSTIIWEDRTYLDLYNRIVHALVRTKELAARQVVGIDKKKWHGKNEQSGDGQHKLSL
jgi:hypothetical protein